MKQQELTIEKIYKANKSVIYYSILNNIKNVEVVEELTNEVFLKFNKVLYLSAIIEMTGFYVNNKEHIGIVPTLEPFAQTYSANNQDQLIKQAEEQYDALIKFIKENSKMNLPKQ